MKRKRFTRPPNMTRMGKYIYNTMFDRNVDFEDMANGLDTTASTIRGYLIKPVIPTKRILQMCAILANTKTEYDQMVAYCITHLPEYNKTYWRYNND